MYNSNYYYQYLKHRISNISYEPLRSKLIYLLTRWVRIVFKLNRWVGIWIHYVSEFVSEFSGLKKDFKCTCTTATGKHSKPTRVVGYKPSFHFFFKTNHPGWSRPIRVKKDKKKRQKKKTKVIKKDKSNNNKKDENNITNNKSQQATDQFYHCQLSEAGGDYCPPSPPPVISPRANESSARNLFESTDETKLEFIPRTIKKKHRCLPHPRDPPGRQLWKIPN